MFSTTVGVFALSFATGTVGISANQFLIASLAGNVLCLIGQPFWARLSDKVGRRPIIAGTLVLIAVLCFPYFAAIATANMFLIGATVALLMLVFAGANSVQASFYAEQFPAKVRYTGMAVGMQLASWSAGSPRRSRPRSPAREPAGGSAGPSPPRSCA